MTGKSNVWPVKASIRPDIVRWPAVIFSPVIGENVLLKAYKGGININCHPVLLYWRGVEPKIRQISIFPMHAAPACVVGNSHYRCTCTGFVQVLENLDSPGILFWHYYFFQDWKVLEKGHWLNSSSLIFQTFLFNLLSELMNQACK